MDTIPDPNNNSGEKSYSLRPRTTLKKDEEETDQEDWRPRGRSKRRQKQKCLPLSKYRRKTANARERSRMREINDAFEALRRVLPHFNTKSDNPSEKTTKIMTLRLAMKYITALDCALRQADIDSDGESLISDYSVNSREHALTPSSSSEHSDIFDQLFINPAFEEYSQSTISSCAISPFSSEHLTLPCRNSGVKNSKFDTPPLFPKTTPTPSSNYSNRLLHFSPDDLNLGLSKTSLLPKPSSYTPLTPNISPQPECPTTVVDDVKNSISVDTHEYTTMSWRDFDCLPPSPINLDDLLIT